MNKKGQIYKLKLDDRSHIIYDYLQKGVSKASIAKIVGVTEKTLAKWIKRNPVGDFQ